MNKECKSNSITSEGFNLSNAHHGRNLRYRTKQSADDTINSPIQSNMNANMNKMVGDVHLTVVSSPENAVQRQSPRLNEMHNNYSNQRLASEPAEGGIMTVPNNDTKDRLVLETL